MLLQAVFELISRRRQTKTSTTTSQRGKYKFIRLTLRFSLQRVRSADQSCWLPCWSYFFPPVFPYSAILAITCNLYTADRTNSRSYQNKSSNKSMFPSFFMKMLHFYGSVSLYQNVANLAAWVWWTCAPWNIYSDLKKLQPQDDYARITDVKWRGDDEEGMLCFICDVRRMTKWKREKCCY